ncbi:MAG: hypothetical protein JXA67_15770, partial [Micromonosporaceae bacterium]|nr:hypothetical protein [Micromonosporaceae bacterium]
MACGALAGAAASMVSYTVETTVEHEGNFSVGGLLLNGAIGAVIGGITGGVGSIAGQGLKAGVSALASGVGARAAAQVAGRAAGQEARAIASGLTRGAVGKGSSSAAAESAAGRVAGNCNSFTPGTAVLLADGISKPIEEVATGDEVIAADPETGEITAKPVVATITTRGQKHLVEITVDPDGAAGDAIGTVTATDTHPFWVRDLNTWVDATDLQPGQWLRTSVGTWIQITALKRWTVPAQRVHNLTVNGLHTYHV